MKTYEEALLVALRYYVDYRATCRQLSNARRNNSDGDVEYWDEWRIRYGDSTHAQQTLVASIYDIPEDQVAEDLRRMYRQQSAAQKGGEPWEPTR